MAHMRRTPQEIWRLDATKFVVLVILLIFFLSQIIYGCGGPTSDDVATGDTVANDTVTDDTATGETETDNIPAYDANDGPTLLAPALDHAIEPGEVTFEGIGLPGSYVQLAFDDEPLDKAEVDAEGNWSYVTQLDVGQYDLSLQTLDADGHVAATSGPFPLDVGDMSAAVHSEPGDDTSDADATDQTGTDEAAENVTEENVIEENVTEENVTEENVAEENVAGENVDTPSTDSELPVEPEVKIIDIPLPTAVATPMSTMAPLTLDLSGFDNTSGPGLRTPKGTGPANSMVEILIDNEVQKSTTVSEDGQWSSLIAFPAPGKYIIAARTLDENGEIVSQTRSEVVRIAAPTPVPVVKVIAPSFDETALNEENLQLGMVALNGAGQPDTALELTIDRNSMVTTTIDPEGN